MPTYKYTARDQESKSVSGRIAADNEPMIVAELRKRNLIILSIEEEKESVFKKTAKPRGPKKIKPEDLIIFTRQFATMVDAGIPILQSLEALNDQTSNLTFKAALLVIREDIQTGSSLSSAFAKHPKLFDQ